MERMKEMAKVIQVDIVQHNNFKETFSAFPLHLKQLILNPAYICIAIAIGTVNIFITGMGNFAAQFVESQYFTTASTAAVIVGVTLITTGG